MAVAQIPFFLDEAKFAPPTVRPASIDKKDAIARLVAATGPFATLIAPPGYGKTTLLSRWAAVDPRPFAWVSVDGRDDDSIVFLRSIAAAINRVEQIPSTVFDALSGPGDSILTRVPVVGNALAAMKRSLVVALDDLHAITNPDCLNALAALFDYVPPKSLIAITSRLEPALPIARWRARGMLLEIKAPDLRLDHVEADRLLKSADVTLDESDVVDLTERTEGWPAGIYLAALSLRSSGAVSNARIETITGNDRFVSDYLRLEILSRLGDEEASFLLHTSVLERMSGPLCDAVLERQGSADMLTSLERSNNFVVALDNRGECYRYHHLFRQLLQNELERAEPAAIRTLNKRAMDWCIAKGDLEAAARYGHAAGETETIAGIIDRISLQLYYDGRIETMEEMLGWFDDDALARFPALAVFAAWARVLTGRGPEAEKYIAIADWATSEIPLSDGSATIEPWVATIRAEMMPDGAEQALLDAERALDTLAPDSAFRPDATLGKGVARALTGSADAGRADLETALKLARDAGAVDVEFAALSQLALLEADQGAWAEAQFHARAARDVVEGARLSHYPGAAIAYAAVARVAIHTGQQQEARAAMTRAHRLRPMLDYSLPWLTVRVGNELARAHLALGETDAARSVLEETEAILRKRPNLGTLANDTRDLRKRLDATSGPGAWGVSLTAAELRLLPYLATHLTFPEIGSRLFVTSHTIRSQAKSIYQKLDATSRAEAVDRAVDVGLLEPMFPHRSAVAIQ